VKTRTLALIFGALLLVSTSAFAQGNNDASDEGSADVTEDFCFSSGSGNAFLRWCVSRHGNLVHFESPGGSEHIRVATRLEGYAVCSGTTLLNQDTADGGESGWTPAFVVVASGAGGVTLRRTSADGRWELTQKWSRDTKELDLSVLMTLKNLGPGTISDVRLARIVDWDNNNTFGDDTQDRSDRGVWARDNPSLRSTTLSNIKFTQAVDTALAGFGAACSPASVATPTTSDVTSVVTARLGPLNAGKAATTTFVYRRQ
jgi:hypothetical protein